MSVSAAIERARAALPLLDHLPKLERYRERLEGDLEELARLISSEVGKPLWESRTEVKAMIGKIAISIDAQKERCPSWERGALSVTHRPHGVLAVLGPFNFPAHLPNGHMVPALLAGNSVVFKPSEFAPKTGEWLTDALRACDLPVELVQGGGEVGHELATHEGIDGLLFTGSASTGAKLSAHFGKHPEKILALEMGGNNPMVVTHVADLHAAAHTLVLSAFLTAGQRCTCARRLILTPDGEAVLEPLIELMGKVTVGPYTQTPEPFMGPVIHEAAAKRMMEVQAQGNPLVPMTRDGAFLTPGLIEMPAPKDEEYFGPLLQVVRVPNFEAAIDEANNTRYGLSAGLLSDSRQEWEQFRTRVRAGVINWNCPTTGASSAAPFGGVGISGNHRPTAQYAADTCSYPVASMTKTYVEIQSTPGLPS